MAYQEAFMGTPPRVPPFFDDAYIATHVPRLTGRAKSLAMSLIRFYNKSVLASRREVSCEDCHQ